MKKLMVRKFGAVIDNEGCRIVAFDAATKTSIPLAHGATIDEAIAELELSVAELKYKLIVERLA